MAEEIETGVRPSVENAEAPPISAAPATNGAGGDGSPPGDSGERRGIRDRFGRVNQRSFRRIVVPVVAVVALIALIVGVYVYVNNLWYVSTDNAQVDGTPVQVGSLNAGRVEAINVQVGSVVNKGDVLARVLLPTQVESAAIREGIYAPFDGTVIAVPVGVGATVQPGQGIVTVVDPSTLYVNANIDETSVRHVAVGQPVDVYLDALNETVTGFVESVTPASAATFSLLPQNNSSGTFTKVTQLIPVKISIPFQDSRLTVGTSAEVKIHVAGH
jgi:multidrug resistance efflux pump